MVLMLLPAIMTGANVCEIVGDKQYADFGDALAAIKHNQTIRLLQTINYSGSIQISDKSITFDLNGYNLNVENAIPLYVNNVGSEVKLTGKGEFNVTSTGLWLDGVAVYNGGKATVTNATGPGSGVYARNNATVTVLGNVTSIVGGATDAHYYGVNADDNSNVTVNGDVFANRTGVYARNGSVVQITGSVISHNDRGISAGSGANVSVNDRRRCYWKSRCGNRLSYRWQRS